MASLSEIIWEMKISYIKSKTKLFKPPHILEPVSIRNNIPQCLLKLVKKQSHHKKHYISETDPSYNIYERNSINSEGRVLK